ncbi:MAG: serine hydrolase, partial [Bacteroidia bacterium]|nr:serine hydrolase [Bacteroidia bacterium]
MNKSFSLLITIALFHNSLHGQITDIVKSDSISSILHQENIGKITFMSKPIPLEEYKAADFLDYYEIKEKGDLNIRTFLGNSLTNYLHLLSPEMPADELT